MKFISAMLFFSRFVVLLLVPFFASCSSFTIYKESDCETPSKEFGSCFADQGYDLRALPSLAKFCKEKGKPLNEGEFKKAREDRLQKNCSTEEGVFTLSFRYPANLNGPAVCSDKMLTTPKLKLAAEDGTNAGLIYGSLSKYDKDREIAEKHEEENSNNILNALGNRAFRQSSAEAVQEKEKAIKRYEAIVAKYPKVKGELLTTRLKCTKSGLL